MFYDFNSHCNSLFIPADLDPLRNVRSEKSQSIGVRKNRNARPVDLDPEVQVEGTGSIRNDHHQKNDARIGTIEIWILSFVVEFYAQRGEIYPLKAINIFKIKVKNRLVLSNITCIL